MRRALTLSINGKTYYTTKISSPEHQALNVVKWPGVVFQKIGQQRDSEDQQPVNRNRSEKTHSEAARGNSNTPSNRGTAPQKLISANPELAELNRVEWPGNRSQPVRQPELPEEEPKPAPPAVQPAPPQPKPEPAAPPSNRKQRPADNGQANLNTWKTLTAKPVDVDAASPGTEGGTVVSNSNGRSDWIEARRSPRRACRIPVDFACYNRICAGMVRDLSLCGAFIKTESPLKTGEELFVSIPFSENKRPVKLKAVVVRTDSEGMGVEFKRRVV